jgi:hypothetical protein
MDYDSKHQKIQTIAMVVITGLVGFFVAPFVFIAIKGIVGLVVAAAISFVAIQFMPYFGSLVANWRLKAIKAEASKNPIETLQNDLMDKANGLANYKVQLGTLIGSIRLNESRFSDFKEKYPANTSAIQHFQDDIDKMKSVYKLRVNKYQQAMANLSAYEDKINWAKGEWEMAQSIAEMNKVAALDGDAFLKQIQVDTAFDSVQKSVAVAFSDLEISFVDESSSNTPIKNVTGTVDSAPPVKALTAPSNLSSLGLNLDINGLEDEKNTIDISSSPPKPSRSRFASH